MGCKLPSVAENRRQSPLRTWSVSASVRFRQYCYGRVLTQLPRSNLIDGEQVIPTPLIVVGPYGGQNTKSIRANWMFPQPVTWRHFANNSEAAVGLQWAE
jgi:hypothetical protein